ncbi:MAG: peptide chain release factor N(5)-glutamine methyltransferase [Candidatus Eisenbacteria sp.]|nr:peptide chain release factor N(5)-glutamine methyltransferase [Candidatus Eisenbacteria bacterium]
MLVELLSKAVEAIEVIGAGNPRFEAELLLSHALDRPRTFLFTHPEYHPTALEESRFVALLDRRLSSEPLQYVLGTAAFRHLTLRVHRGVLIPRSETEVLVDRAWEALQRWAERRLGMGGPQPSDAPASGAIYRGSGSSGKERPWVIDVGVGCGSILLALMFEAIRGRASRNQSPAVNGSGFNVSQIPKVPGVNPWFRPLGIDIAAVPLQLTAENAEANGLSGPDLIVSDLLSAVDPAAPVAAIVSNPPYVSTSDMQDLPAEIREYEPHEALHGGADGLDAIRELLDQALVFIHRGALLCFEIGADQERAIEKELQRRNLQRCSRILPDLTGRPRVVLVEPWGASA